MDKKDLDVTILLPCYNEEKALREVVENINSVIGKSVYSYEILVVDDKSTDNSASVAQNLGCRVIRHVFNRGAGTSRKTGILAAYGKVIAMLDADGTYSASDLPKMLRLIPEYDQVNGVRESEKGTLRWLRQPVKWAIRMIASFLAGRRIPDLNTGLKVFKRNIMLQYLWVIPDGFSCVTSMTLAFLCNGHSVAYVPISYKNRIGRSKFHPIKDTYLYMLTVLRLITYFNPLKFFFPVSLFLIVFGVIKALFDRFSELHRLQLSDIVLILTGVIVAFQGFLADLIVAQSKNRYANSLKDNVTNNESI